MKGTQGIEEIMKEKIETNTMIEIEFILVGITKKEIIGRDHHPVREKRIITDNVDQDQDLEKEDIIADMTNIMKNIIQNLKKENLLQVTKKIS